MKYSPTRQNTQLNNELLDFNAQEVNGVLYFTVNFGTKGKQRWKTDGKNTVFVTNV